MVDCTVISEQQEGVKEEVLSVLRVYGLTNTKPYSGYSGYRRRYITDHICKNETVTIREQYSANFGDMRNPYRISVGKAERKRKFERLLNRWEDHIKCLS